MARRGKAASRQARQRRRAAQRSATRPATTPPAASQTEAPAAESATTTTSTGASVAAPSVRSSVPASQRGSRVNPRLAVAGPSRLTERAIAEYHYVKRDLRNIGILVAIMAAILVVAVIAFTALGIGKAA